ncbi:MAG: hypothetical protein AB7U20_06900 [Planctomycetaceae bacterium]
MAQGKIQSVTSEGGQILCSDNSAGGHPTIRFVDADIRYGEKAKGAAVTYSIGTDASGRPCAKAITVEAE